MARCHAAKLNSVARGRNQSLMHTSQCLRAHIATWIITAILPLPVLVATDPAGCAEISCLYLGLGCAWLVMEIYRSGELPESVRDWGVKMLAISIAVVTNLLIFVLFGLAGAVQTNIPLPLMAALSVVPAIGLMPRLARADRAGQCADARYEARRLRRRQICLRPGLRRARLCRGRLGLGETNDCAVLEFSSGDIVALYVGRNRGG